jgi:hypothetical protein
VSQVLRISLDAGSQLDHFETFYRAASGNEPLAVAVGLKKAKDAQKEFNAERGRLTIWEPMEKNLGMQGLAVIVNPGEVDQLAEDKQNNLVVLKASTTAPVSYWAGFAWDRAGKITSAESWKKYVDDFAAGRRAPVVVSVK